MLFSNTNVSSVNAESHLALPSLTSSNRYLTQRKFEGESQESDGKNERDKKERDKRERETEK